jgi:lysophospholipase L1-like esterase
LGDATDFGSCTYAYNRVYATGTNPACALRRADNHTCTVLIGKNGVVDVSVGTPCTGTGPTGTTGASTVTQFCTGTTCYISTVYNQRGSNNFVNTANNTTQPIFAFGAINYNSQGPNLPAIQCVAAANTIVQATITAGTQPYTYSYISNRTDPVSELGITTGGFNGTTGSRLGHLDNTGIPWFRADPGTAYSGSNKFDSQLHAYQVSINGASTLIGIDGTNTSGLNIGSGNDQTVMGICNEGSNDLPWGGYIGEVGRWFSASTTTQATALCANQQARYGVLATPVASAGNLLCAPPTLTLVAHGDSITDGYGLSPDHASAYPNVLATNKTAGLKITTSVNFGDISAGFTSPGVSGYTLDQSAPLWVDPYVGTPGARLIIFAGTNGLNGSGATGASVFADFVTYFNARLTAGWSAGNIIVVESLPRGPGGNPTNRVAYNALIASNASSMGYQEVPLGTDTVMGQTGQDTNTTYYQDGIHPTAVGQALLAADMFGPTASCSACPGVH